MDENLSSILITVIIKKKIIKVGMKSLFVFYCPMKKKLYKRIPPTAIQYINIYPFMGHFF